MAFPSLKTLTEVADLATENNEVILFGVAATLACDAPCFAGLVWVAGLLVLLAGDARFSVWTIGVLVMNGLLFSSFPSIAIERRFDERVSLCVLSAG